MKTHAQVVVIGGGAMGCSLLYHLTKLGWTDVVLVEKNELTAGSTWHAAGLCTHFAHNLTIMQMRAYSARLYKSELEADTGRPVGFHQCGALRVTSSVERMDEFMHVQQLGRFVGQEFHLLTPTELKAIYPLVEIDGLLGAFYEPLDGYVDPSQATHAMAGGARDRGAQIYRHNPVESIARTSNGLWRVSTRDGVIDCDIVVNAAGTWAREIGAMLGLDLPVVPMLHQYIVTDSIPEIAQLERELPMIRDPEESWYIRQEREGLIVGPYERDGQPWGVDGIPAEFGMDLMPPDLERVAPILEAAMARVPAFADAGIKRVVNGPITFTPDATPLVGPAPGLEGAWLLTGSSMGVMEGGGAGKFLAEWIVGGEPPMDAIAVDPRRFGPWADRQYRLDKAVESFANQFGIHFPLEERRAGRCKRTAATYAALQSAGAEFGVVNGWERPNWFCPTPPPPGPAHSFRRARWYGAVAAECLAVRDRVGLTDMSQLSKFEVLGPDATRFMDTLGANRPPRAVGGIALTHALTPTGGVASEFTVTRLADSAYYLTSAAAAEIHDLDLLSRHGHGLDVSIRNVTDAFGVLTVSGPAARALLGPLAEANLDSGAFPWLHAQQIRVAGIPVRALRVSYVGELGWELHCPRARQADLLAALVTAGRPLGAAFYGAIAMNALRLEKGYRAWGADLSTERTPLEAGLGALIRTEGRAFTGRDALVAGAPRRRPMRMELLSLAGEGTDPYYGHPVSHAGRVVGLVTSGARGFRTGQRLALAYLDVAVSHDAALEVRVLEASFAAEPLAQAPYDPGNLRLRG